MAETSFRARLLGLLHEAGMSWGDVERGASLQQLVRRLERKYETPTEPKRSSAPPSRRPSQHAIKKP